jgi:hypothetical protein
MRESFLPRAEEIRKSVPDNSYSARARTVNAEAGLALRTNMMTKAVATEYDALVLLH